MISDSCSGLSNSERGGDSPPQIAGLRLVFAFSMKISRPTYQICHHHSVYACCIFAAEFFGDSGWYDAVLTGHIEETEPNPDREDVFTKM